jgi:hypothetical protein
MAIKCLPVWSSKLPRVWSKRFEAKEELGLENLQEFRNMKAELENLRKEGKDPVLQVFWPSHDEFRADTPVHPAFIRYFGSADTPEVYPHEPYDGPEILREDEECTRQVYYGPSDGPTYAEEVGQLRNHDDDDKSGDEEEEPPTPTKDENLIQVKQEVCMIGEDNEILLAENDNSVAIIVDTGATASVIGVDRAQRLQKFCLSLNFERAGRTYKSAAGTRMTVLSSAKYRLPEIGMCCFDVLDCETTPALLGNDFLDGATVDLRSNMIIKGDSRIRLQSLANGHRVVLVSMNHRADPPGNSGARRSDSDF